MKQDINSKIGRNIRAERIRKSLTSIELAKQLGISDITLRTWETGKAKIPVYVLFELSKALNCEIESFFKDL